MSTTVDLTLAPYLTATGVLFDPVVLGNLFTNTGGGIYTLTLVGAPEPAVPRQRRSPCSQPREA